MFQLCRRWLQDRRAVTATEYGIIVSALAFALVAMFSQLGVPLAAVFTNVATKM